MTMLNSTLNDANKNNIL